MEDEYEWIETTEHIVLEFGSCTNPSDSWLNSIDQGIQLVGLDHEEVFLKAGGTVYRGFYEDNALCEDLVFSIHGDIPTAQQEGDEVDGPLAPRDSTRGLTGEEEDDLETSQDEPLLIEEYDEEPIDATMELVGIVTKKIIFEKVVLDINSSNIQGDLLGGSAQETGPGEVMAATSNAPTADGEGADSGMDLDRQ